jgi:polyribonucleotide 5'-hydroxyl-kinase
MEGECKAYIGERTPMAIYGNNHYLLQQLRNEARENKTIGPVVMVVGAMDTGKSSLCTILSNYAVRMDEQPIFVDLDIGQNSIAIPGVLAAVHIERPIDVEDGFGNSQPLVQFFGDVSPHKNPKLYLEQIRNLYNAVRKKMDLDSNVAASGMIINTCGWVDGDGYQYLLEAIEIFSPTVVYVLDHERLCSSLTDDVKSENVKIVKLPKSGGVVSRDMQARKKFRKNQLKEYFYGVAHDLCPRSVQLQMQSVSFYKIVPAYQAPSSTLPVGMSVEQSTNNEPQKVNALLDMRHLIIAVSYAKKPEELVQTNIAGFLHITEVNFEKQIISALSPNFDPPGDLILLSNIKYIEVD